MRHLPRFAALRAFEAAARLESFQLAGTELHLTPSAISHQVRGLEAWFGQALFRRGNRQVSLTDEGRRLLARLTPAFDAIESACAELGPAPSATGLSLHAVPSFATKWLGPRLPAFMRQHPEIQLRLSASADPVDLLRSDDYDLAITYGQAPEARGLATEPLGSEEILVLASPALAARIDLDDLRALARVPRIESTLNPVRWPDWFQLNGLKLPAGGGGPAFDRGALAVSAAVQGLGLALESRRFAAEELARGELVVLGEGRFKPIRRPLHFLCYRAADRERPRVVAFRDWLRAAVAAEG